MSEKSTSIFIALVAGIFLNLPFYAYAFEKDWFWTYSFLPVWMNNALSMFITFFHEIGHSVAGWFYGIPTIPMFDFAHGGGWAWMVTEQKYLLLFCVWAGLGYLWFLLREFVLLQYAVIALFLFNIATAFTNAHLAMFDFMGPVAECLIGGFLLFRFLFDMCPRGIAEKYLNGALGIAFPMHAIIDGLSLIYVPSARERYYAQKDAQGAGDFDQIADKLDFISFNAAVSVWIGIAFLSLVVPFLLWQHYYRYYEGDGDDTASTPLS